MSFPTMCLVIVLACLLCICESYRQYRNGYEEGLDSGLSAGKKEGYAEGFKAGRAEGYNKGVKVGYEAGKVKLSNYPAPIDEYVDHINTETPQN